MPSQHSQSSNRIKRLDNRLANQIAAGEVVERPASVVKELLENAIDAGATRIEVDVERGGTRLIRITDNGCGIVKDDLSLALSRHATSKISTTSDLASIHSLGFRGEALASIGSVSRLCLTSRTRESDFAWQAIAEGRDMQVDIQPASATVGTRIEVRDLFYNTPARQKFLRAEKTEFGHIEEIFKRHAIANVGTAFILKHNHKVIKRVPAGRDQSDYLKRIEIICGKAFADNAIPFNCQHEAINIEGWLGKSHFHRSESDIQYVFINGRPVKDKMLNHAIRQSYQGLLPPGRMPTFVIFLNIDASKIDVNVHPTKHEVRFDEQRMVHDLLVRSVSEALANEPSLDVSIAIANLSPATQENSKLTNNAPIDNDYSLSMPTRNTATGVGYSRVSYPLGEGTKSPNLRQNNQQEVVSTYHQHRVQADKLSDNKIRFNNGLWLSLVQQKAFLIDEEKLLSEHLSNLLNTSLSSSALWSGSKPLLFPQSIPLDTSDLEEFETLKLLQQLGFVFEPGRDSFAGILLQQIPNWLEKVDKQMIFTQFPKWVKSMTGSDSIQLDNGVLLASVFKAIYQSLMPLNEMTIDYLLSNPSFSIERSAASKQMTSENAKTLFFDGVPICP